MTACPHCGQRMSEYRLGVRLPPLKARIFDIVLRAGPGGIAGADLREALGAEHRGKHGLRAHIWQINEELDLGGTGYRIAGGWDGYRIVRSQ